MQQFGIQNRFLNRVKHISNSVELKKAEEGTATAEHWITVNGRHVLIDEKGEVKQGGQGIAGGEDLKKVGKKGKTEVVSEEEEQRAENWGKKQEKEEEEDDSIRGAKEKFFKNFFTKEKLNSDGVPVNYASFDVMKENEEGVKHLESDVYYKDNIGVYKASLRDDKEQKKYVWKPENN